MINTITIKPKGGKVFTIGVSSQSLEDAPTDRILIVGSCRSVPYINYLDRYIRMTGAKLMVQFIDPNDWHWDEQGQSLDFEAQLLAQEHNPSVLDAIRFCTIYIHEHYAAYGMFNSLPESAKNIYQFGMAPRLNITIPNFHDHFILFNELADLDKEVARMIVDDRDRLGRISQDTLDHIKALGDAAIEKFCTVCSWSSFPEMEQHFRDNWRTTRFFWTGNHISRHFSLFIFRQMNDRFLHLPLTDEFWRGAETEDLFAFPCTELSPHDITNHNIKWT